MLLARSSAGFSATAAKSVGSQPSSVAPAANEKPTSPKTTAPGGSSAKTSAATAACVTCVVAQSSLSREMTTFRFKMTPEEILSWSPEIKREMIATACGWKMLPRAQWLHKGDPKKRHPSGYHSTVCNGKVPTEIPDYCNDLNAMHQAEKVLDLEQCRFYDAQIWHLLPESKPFADTDGFRFHASATVRADTFLITICATTVLPPENNPVLPPP